MLFHVVLSYLPYAAVTAFTPGPNNIIALYAVSRGGWRKGIRALLGMTAGFILVMLLCGFFCYELARWVPSITKIMKYVGAAYIIWLAIHIARAKPGEEGGREVSFWQGFFLEFVNVKIILYAITAYTAYVLPASNDLPFLLANGICFTIIGASGMFTWAAAGGVLQRFLQKYERPFNYAMALVLLLCAIGLLL